DSFYYNRYVFIIFFFFFFSSRRRHTRSDRDWSSDVCSSDLEDPSSIAMRVTSADDAALKRVLEELVTLGCRLAREQDARLCQTRSEERRVGKECRSQWWPCH